MTVAFRIIPKLDIKGPNLVKGMHLEGLRVLGKPEEFAEHYYKEGADELIYQDVVASLYGRNSLNEIISRTAKNIFIPLTVGGGIKNLDDIYHILRSGADKVCINTAAINNPSLIKEASKEFGVSTIVIGIEAIIQENGDYLAFTDNGRNETGKNAIHWSQEAEDLGAGEILITSVDREGTGEGFDSNLISKVCEKVSIPVVGHGGVGSYKDVQKLIDKCHLSGVALASVLHYDYINMNRQLDGYEVEGNTEFLKSKRTPSNIKPISIQELKTYLSSNSLNIRLIQ